MSNTSQTNLPGNLAVRIGQIQVEPGNVSTTWNTNDTGYTTRYWDFNGPTVKTVPDIVFTKEDTLETIKGSLNAVYGTNKTYLKNETYFKTCPCIKRVIFNPPATIVMWEDGTKTIVKCTEGEEFKEELGLAMAIAKRYFGSRSKFKKEVAKASRPQEKTFKNEAEILATVAEKLKTLDSLIKKTFPVSKGADDE